MSRGDEIQEDAPKPRWRDDNEEPDEPRDRGNRVRIDKPNRSGAITAVGIVAIILGSLDLLCGLCGSSSGILCTAGAPFFQDFMKQAAAQDPNLKKNPDLAKAMKEIDKAEPAGWVAIGFGVVNILCGAGLLTGGIFVLRRSNFARYLTLGVAVVDLLAGCGHAGTLAALGFMQLGQGIQMGVGMVIGIAFVVFAGVVLLNPKNAKEFAV